MNVERVSVFLEDHRERNDRIFLGTEFNDLPCDISLRYIETVINFRLWEAKTEFSFLPFASVDFQHTP